MKANLTTDLHQPHTPAYFSHMRKPNSQSNYLFNYVHSLQSILPQKKDEEFTIQQNNPRLIKGINRMFSYITPIIESEEEKVDTTITLSTAYYKNTVTSNQNGQEYCSKSKPEIEEHVKRQHSDIHSCVVDKACSGISLVRKGYSEKNDILWSSANESFKKCLANEIQSNFDGISYSKALALIEESIKLNLDFQGKVVEMKPQCKLCVRTKKMGKNIEQELNTLLDFQYIKYDENNSLHNQILKSIEGVLLCNATKPSPGSLKLIKASPVHVILHVLYFIECNARQAQEYLANDDSFLSVCVRCSYLLMSRLKEGCLNKKCLQCGSAKIVFVSGFCALLLNYYSRKWKSIEEFERKCNGVLTKLLV